MCLCSCEITPVQALRFPFSGNLSQLPEPLRARFILNTVDAEMRAFLDGCEPSRLRFFKHWCAIDRLLAAHDSP